VIRAKAETGEDIHLWMFIYQQKGPEVIVDGDLTQTLLLYGKFGDRERTQISDTPFINKGQNIDDYLPPGSIQCTEGVEQITWSNAGRTFVSKPPHWEIGGEHAGVKINIKFKEYSQAYFHCGRFEDLKPDQGTAGYIVHGTATGTIEVQGKTLTIAEGWGVHERIFMAGIVSPRVDYKAGRGSHWMHGWGKEFSWYLLNGDIGSSVTAMVNIDGELATVKGRENGWVEEVAHWIDPKSNQLCPYKWNIWMVTDKGRLDATVTGFTRGYYTWVRRFGQLVVYQFAADCKATFKRTDGTVIESNVVASVDYMRTLNRQPEC